MSENRISVVIYCHSENYLLAETLRSLQTQAQPAAEVILLLSAEERERIIQFPELPTTLIRTTDFNQASAYNRGLLTCRGDFVVCLKAGDRLPPNALNISATYLNAMPQCQFVLGLARTIGNSELPFTTARELFDQWAGASIYQTLLKGACVQPLSQMMVRRRAILQAGSFDPTLHLAADYDLCLRLAATRAGGHHNQVVVEHPADQLSIGTLCPSKWLQAYLSILDRQKSIAAATPENRQAYQEGYTYWHSVYRHGLVQELSVLWQQKQYKAASLVLACLLRYYPAGLLEVLGKVRGPQRPSAHLKAINSISAELPMD